MLDGEVVVWAEQLNSAALQRRVVFEAVEEVDALVSVLRDLPRARNRVW